MNFKPATSAIRATSGVVWALLVASAALAQAPERKHLECKLASVTEGGDDGKPLQTRPHSETVYVAFYDGIDGVLLNRGQVWYDPSATERCDVTVAPMVIRLECFPESEFRDGRRIRISRVSGEVLWERIGGFADAGKTSLQPHYRFKGTCELLPTDPLVPPKTRF